MSVYFEKYNDFIKDLFLPSNSKKLKDNTSFNSLFDFRL